MFKNSLRYSLWLPDVEIIFFFKLYFEENYYCTKLICILAICLNQFYPGSLSLVGGDGGDDITHRFSDYNFFKTLACLSDIFQ